MATITHPSRLDTSTAAKARWWGRKADRALGGLSSRLSASNEVGMRRCLWLVSVIVLILALVVCALAVSGCGKKPPELIRGAEKQGQEIQSTVAAPVVSRRVEMAPISEEAWFEIFWRIYETREHLSYLDAVLGCSTESTRNSTKKLAYYTAKLKNTEGKMDASITREMKAALEQGLIGHLLSWYASELSPFRATYVWLENRKALLDNRQVYMKIGLDWGTLEKSFNNMNIAARRLGLPTVKNLN
jgi:hypothetical protein